MDYSCSKKTGGPIRLLFLTLLAGYGIGKTVEGGIRYVIEHGSSNINSCEYFIHTDGESNEGKNFRVGDKFKVLEKHDDAVLIEILGDLNNPYFVNEELLKEISNYE